MALFARFAKKKSFNALTRAVARITLFALFLIFCTLGFIDWGLKWYALSLLLGIKAILGIISLLRKKAPIDKKKNKTVPRLLGNIALIGMVMIPPLVFPGYKQPQPTGRHSVGTTVFTWTDASREDSFTEKEDRRRVTVQFWYPLAEAEENSEVPERPFPLIVFSHGAFGYRMSNHSTFLELASNGYVVASIDHTHQAFLTKEADGTTILGDREFINTAMQVENGRIEGEQLYRIQEAWMDLRSADMAFVLDQIRKHVASPTSQEPFDHMDIERIGVLGHSMGGATAAWIGREDDAIDAVIVLDGTLMGEIIGFEDGRELLTDVPYPKPILNLFNEKHFQDAQASGLEYANMLMHAKASQSFQMVILGSGHLNFTDLPLLSPFFAGLLGTGTVDPFYCMETTNAAVLAFMDYYLKGKGDPIPIFRML
ncbi:MAG: hypothetical protein GX626_07230 [Spirochaetales bacterium]|nr:hypothetical protein [Spirochaetales bacterium]